MEHIVMREKDIRKNNNPPNGFTEDYIRGVLERNGIDFGRTTYVRGDEPNREWTNARQMFMPSNAELAANQAEQEAEAAVKKAEELRAKAEKDQMQKELDELKAMVRKLSGDQREYDNVTVQKPFTETDVAFTNSNVGMTDTPELSSAEKNRIRSRQRRADMTAGKIPPYDINATKVKPLDKRSKEYRDSQKSELDASQVQEVQETQPL